jgi:hypothetical protein
MKIKEEKSGKAEKTIKKPGNAPFTAFLYKNKMTILKKFKIILPVCNFFYKLVV